MAKREKEKTGRKVTEPPPAAQDRQEPETSRYVNFTVRYDGYRRRPNFI
jgi:hypothetical protein